LRDKQLRAYLQSKQVSPVRYRAPAISVKKAKLVKAKKYNKLSLEFGWQ